MQDPAPLHPAYTHADDHLADWHGLTLALLGRWLARHAHRLFDLDGNRHDVDVTLAEAIALSSGAPDAAAPEAVRAAELHVQSLRRQIRRRLETSAAHAPHLAIEDLRALFGLTDLELEVLILCAMPSMSVEVARMIRYLTARDDHRATVGFLAEVCTEPVAGRIARLDALRPDATLRRLGLVAVEGEGVTAAVSVPGSVVDYLQHDLTGLPEGVRGACTLHTGRALDPSELLLDELAAKRLERGLRPRDARLVLVGPPGVGRRTATRAWLGARGIGVIEVDLPHVLATHGAGLLVDAAREARLRRAALLVRADALPEMSAQDAGALRDALAAVSGRLIVTAREYSAPLRRLLPGAETVSLAQQSAELQRAAWRQRTGCTDTAAELVRRFQMCVGAIHNVVEAADDTTVAALTRAARSAASHTLDALAEPLQTQVGWEDIVLAPEVEAKLREVVAHARHRELVFDDWGFGDKVSYGGGLSCLFSGPPGTGKTMMAAVLARELGREVWRVDVSRLVSKWIGETEKNLARVFDEAARAQVVLLFDEADSLFAKRTAVRGANDRHANMEVNFLLQKMESHPGVTILTTNLLKGIDEAFLRRIRFKIAFDAPDAGERAKLWQRLLPPRAPVAGDIDFDALGREFEMSGGHIRNAVLRAAFSAATCGGSIDHATLFDAAVAEAREMGRLVRS